MPPFMCTNRNLTPITAPLYSPEPGVVLPLLTEKGPLAKEYLDALYRVTCQAIHEYGRVLACRFDLTLPHGVPLPEDAASNAPLQRCLASLQAKVKHDRRRRASPHSCRVRYVAAREISQDGMPHFHLLLFFNLHAYNTPGTLDYEGVNLFWMLAEAWASALRQPLEYVVDTVQLSRGRRAERCGNPTQTPDTPAMETASHTAWKRYSHYYLEPRDHYAALPAMFQRGSYLCKLWSKRYGDGYRSFLTSHR